MNKGEVDGYRERVDIRLEELTVMSAKQSSDTHYIKSSVDDIKSLIKDQNSRIRTNEKSIAKIHGVGALLSVFYAGFIAWLFKLKG